MSTRTIRLLVRLELTRTRTEATREQGMSKIDQITGGLHEMAPAPSTTRPSPNCGMGACSASSTFCAFSILSSAERPPGPTRTPAGAAYPPPSPGVAWPPEEVDPACWKVG